MTQSTHISFRELGLRFFAREHEEIVRRPLDAPAAWKGSQLAAGEEWIEVLADEHLAELDEALSSVSSRGLELLDVGREDFPLPTLAPEIRRWSEEIARGRGFVLVRGFPVDDYSEEEAGLIYWGIGQHMGTPGRQNAEGHLLGHVCDTGAKEDDPMVRAYQTADHIAFHADLSDAVGLLCLRPARSGGASRVVSSVAVYNEILARRPDLIETLYEPFCIDRRGEEGEGELPYVPIPLCRYAGGRLSTFYHSDYIRSAQRHAVVPRFSDKQRELIELYEEIAGSPVFYLDMDFRPGDMQFLSNRVCLHARTAYDDFEEPERKRHLLRLWLAFD